MSTQEFHSVPVRSAQQIVDQTEALAALMMKNLYQREPVSPGILFRDSKCLRAQHAWRLACEIQGFLTNTDPEDALSELDDTPAADAPAPETEPTGYLVVQEGGSSTEIYTHGFNTEADADAYRASCSNDGSYRTSEPIAVPLSLMDHPAFGQVAEQIAAGAINVDYPEE